jgi:hypothetical protein
VQARKATKGTFCAYSAIADHGMASLLVTVIARSAAVLSFSGG